MSPTEDIILAEIRQLRDTIHGADGGNGLVGRLVRLETRMGLLTWIGGLVTAGLVSAWTTALATGAI